MDDAERKMQFLFALRSKGVTDARVLTAMERLGERLLTRAAFATAYGDGDVVDELHAGVWGWEEEMA